jgi:hypothetical protein
MPQEAIRSVLRDAEFSGMPLRFRYKSATASAPIWTSRYIRSVSGRYFTASQTRTGETRRYRLDRVYGAETIETWPQPVATTSQTAATATMSQATPPRRFRWSTVFSIAFWPAVIALSVGWYVLTDHSSSACAVPAERQYISNPGNAGGAALCNDGTYSHSSGPGTCSHHHGVDRYCPGM